MGSVRAAQTEESIRSGRTNLGARVTLTGQKIGGIRCVI